MRKSYLDIYLVYSTIVSEGENGVTAISDEIWCCFPSYKEAVNYRNQKEYMDEVQVGTLEIKPCRLFKEATPT